MSPSDAFVPTGRWLGAYSSMQQAGAVVERRLCTPSAGTNDLPVRLEPRRGALSLQDCQMLLQGWRCTIFSTGPL